MRVIRGHIRSSGDSSYEHIMDNYPQGPWVRIEVFSSVRRPVKIHLVSFRMISADVYA